MILIIIIVLMLVAISYATAVSSLNDEEKESPLYRIRSNKATAKDLGKIIQQIKTKFLGERLFLDVLKWVRTGLQNQRQFGTNKDTVYIVSVKIDCY